MGRHLAMATTQEFSQKLRSRQDRLPAVSQRDWREGCATSAAAVGGAPGPPQAGTGRGCLPPPAAALEVTSLEPSERQETPSSLDSPFSLLHQGKTRFSEALANTTSQSLGSLLAIIYLTPVVRALKLNFLEIPFCAHGVPKCAIGCAALRLRQLDRVRGCSAMGGDRR
jgi:hypothetical protein